MCNRTLRSDAGSGSLAPFYGHFRSTVDMLHMQFLSSSLSMASYEPHHKITDQGQLNHPINSCCSGYRPGIAGAKPLLAPY